jgi:hypothetical protein
MSSIPILKPERFQLAALWRYLWRFDRLLALSVTAYTLVLAATLAAAIVDTRLVTGAPVWFKPMKFALSGLLYTSTIIWMLTFVRRGRWLARLLGGVTAVALLVEIGLIAFQAARGVRSHFNVGTPFDDQIFTAMGLTILFVWIANLLAAVLLMAQRLSDRPFAWSMRLALLITAVGAALGILMVRPTPGQAAEIEAGRSPSIVGAHSIGVEDGGPGLPFTGWSMEGGDLRVPHFVGLHALQALPLTGVLINRFGRRRLSQRRRTKLVWIAGLGYLGLILLLTWQALRGQPLLEPDALTLAALAGLVVTVVATGAAVVVTAPRPQD